MFRGRVKVEGGGREIEKGVFSNSASNTRNHDHLEQKEEGVREKQGKSRHYGYSIA